MRVSCSRFCQHHVITIDPTVTFMLRSIAYLMHGIIKALTKRSDLANAPPSLTFEGKRNNELVAGYTEEYVFENCRRKFPVMQRFVLPQQ